MRTLAVIVVLFLIPALIVGCAYPGQAQHARSFELEDAAREAIERRDYQLATAHYREALAQLDAFQKKQGNDFGGAEAGWEFQTALSIGNVRMMDGDAKGAGEATREAYEEYGRDLQSARDAAAATANNKLMLGMMLGAAASIAASRTGNHEAAAQTWQEVEGMRARGVFEIKQVDTTADYDGNPDTHAIRFPFSGALYPFDRIVRVENPQGSCTGSIIGDRLILTNAHCVTEAGTPLSPVSIRRGRHTFPAIEVWTHQGKNGAWDQDRRNDWAILVIEKRLGRSLGFEGSSKRLQVGKSLLAGYSGDFNDGRYLSADYGCKATSDVSGAVIQTDCDISRGSSGAPVFVHDPNANYGGFEFVVALNACGKFISHERNIAVPRSACVVNATQWAPTAAKLRAMYDLPAE